MGEPRETAPRFPDRSRHQLLANLRDICTSFDAGEMCNSTGPGRTCTWTRPLLTDRQVADAKHHGFAVTEAMLEQEALELAGAELASRGLNMFVSVLPKLWRSGPASIAIIVFQDTPETACDHFIEGMRSHWLLPSLQPVSG